MRAVVCRKPGEIALEERPEARPAAGEALIAVRRVGICGTDYHIYEGRHPYLAYPRVMGHELSGVVLEAPTGSGFALDDCVVVNPYLSCGACVACRKGKPNCCVRIVVLGVHGDGGMCERISVPTGNLYPAGRLTFDEAASVEFLSIGAHAVARSGLKPADRALVVGAGPIGLGVALFAGLSGGEVAILDLDPARLDFASQAGLAARTILADGRTAEQVAAATDGDGFDVVFDATGNRASMEQVLLYVGHGGALVLVSVVNEVVAFPDPELHKREATVICSRNALRSDFERVMAAIDAGSVPLGRLLTHRTTLASAALDIPRWTRHKTGLVKALVEIE